MATNKRSRRFVLCIENKDTEDLEKRKIFEVIPDSKAEKEGYLRIIDDSEEGYLYPKSYFITIQLTQEIQDSLLLNK